MGDGEEPPDPGPSVDVDVLTVAIMEDFNNAVAIHSFYDVGPFGRLDHFWNNLVVDICH